MKRKQRPDQLRGYRKPLVQMSDYREADLRLCFRICKKPLFTRPGSINISIFYISPNFKDCM